jgi:hypothetical protein
MVVLAIPERRQISSMEKPGTPSAMSNPSAASRILNVTRFLGHLITRETV